MDAKIMDMAEIILMECESIMPDATSAELIDYYFEGQKLNPQKQAALEKAILDIRISSQSY